MTGERADLAVDFIALLQCPGANAATAADPSARQAR